MGSYPIYEKKFPFLINKFYKIIFFNFLIVRTLITISSYSWLIMWLGVEINLLSFIPIIIKDNYSNSKESGIKYFLIQSLASTILIFSILIIEKRELNININNTITLTIQLSLVIKLGIAPFHIWLPEVIEGLSWINCIIMLTWQKISPIIILILTIKNSLIINVRIILSSVIRGIRGLNQTRIRKILTYSSINHIAWILIRMINSSWIWLIYILIYSIRNLNLIIYLYYINIYYINQINLINSNKIFKIIILLNFISLRGIPPIIGFIPKWLTIFYIIENINILITFIIIVSTLFHIYFYIRVITSSLILKIKETKFYTNNNYNYRKKTKYFIILNLIFIFILVNTNIIF